MAYSHNHTHLCLQSVNGVRLLSVLQEDEQRLLLWLLKLNLDIEPVDTHKSHMKVCRDSTSPIEIISPIALC